MKAAPTKPRAKLYTGICYYYSQERQDWRQSTLISQPEPRYSASQAMQDAQTRIDEYEQQVRNSHLRVPVVLRKGVPCALPDNGTNDVIAERLRAAVARDYGFAPSPQA